MKLDKKSLQLYAVTDRAYLGEHSLSEQVQMILDGGATIVQLREKDLSYDEFVVQARHIKSICTSVPFIINDNLEVAMAVDADGVHIGQDDMSVLEARELLGDKILGVSVQTVEQARLAQMQGADYLGVGTMFETSTKRDAKSVSIETLTQICNAVSIPVVAIGGITTDNIQLLQCTGISGVALVSALFAQPNITCATEHFKQLTNIYFGGTTMKKVLTIAGSDCSGGAGIQADIKTITAHNMYAMSAITALTAQNTLGVSGISNVTSEFVAAQLDSIFTDIRPDAIKIGMVSDKNIIKVIVEKLKQYDATNIVVDPVMVSTSGSSLLSDDAKDTLISELLPLGTVITPNTLEAEVLCGFAITTRDEMIKAAQKIATDMNCNVLIKGGHLSESAADLLLVDNKVHWFETKRIDNPNTHGTGCTLSSAIACNLAAGHDLQTAIKLAKDYITGAISAQLNLGQGRGPLNHMYKL